MLIETVRRQGTKRKLDDSMVPAINIVFLLLIFFMIAGHIEARNGQLMIPASSSQGELIAQDFEIRIIANGDYYLNGEKVEGALSTKIQSFQPSPDSVVVCYVDRNLPYSALNPVLSSVRQLKIKRLQVATEQPL